MVRGAAPSPGRSERGYDFYQGKGFSGVDMLIGAVGGTVFSSTGASFRVVEELTPKSLLGHGKQLEVAVGKVLGGVWTKVAKALTN